MSYPRDLDEYSAGELMDELKDRVKLRLQGKCDYCKRELGCEPSCRFVARHRGTAEAVGTAGDAAKAGG